MKQNNKIYQDKISRYLLEKMKAEGFRGIILDEITKGLSISKKTVYKIYPTKEALYRSVLFFELSNIYQELISLVQEKSSMIEKAGKLSAIIRKYVQLFNEQSLKNLEHEFPEIMEELISFRKERVLPLFNHLLDHSKKLNIIKDYQNELIINLFGSLLPLSSGEKLLSQTGFNSGDVFHSAFEIIINGLLTKKGKKLLAINQRMKNEINKNN